MFADALTNKKCGHSHSGTTRNQKSKGKIYHCVFVFCLFVLFKLYALQNFLDFPTISPLWSQRETSHHMQSLYPFSYVTEIFVKIHTEFPTQ